MRLPDRQRLQHIRTYCIAVQKTICRYGAAFDTYAADEDYQRSISFSILQIGELSGGLSEEYRKATADQVSWGPMRAMRNLVAHNYGKVDHRIVWETAVKDVPALLRFCEEQLQNPEV